MNEYRTNLDKKPDPEFLERFGLKIEPVVFEEEEAVNYTTRINPNIELESHRNICLKKAAEMIGVDLEGKLALDIGCGEGRWSRYMSKHGARVVGIDQSPTMIKIAKKRSGQIPIIYQPLNFSELSRLDKQFDIVVASYIFNNFPNLYEAFQKSSEVTKDNGEIVIITKTFETENGQTLKEFKDLFLPILINRKYLMYVAANSFEEYNLCAQQSDFKLDEHFSQPALDEIGNNNLQNLGIQIEDHVVKYKKLKS